MKNLVFLIALGLTVLFSACNNSPCVNSAPDLIVKISNEEQIRSITVGDSVTIETQVYNVADAKRLCSNDDPAITDNAVASSLGFTVKNCATCSDILLDKAYETPAIEAGNFVSVNRNMIFTEPGLYYIDLMADKFDVVVERNENNNKIKFFAGEKRTDTPDHLLKIEVKANPNYIRPQGAPVVIVR